MQIAKTLLTNLERIAQVIRQLRDKMVTCTHRNILHPMLLLQERIFFFMKRCYLNVDMNLNIYRLEN